MAKAVFLKISAAHINQNVIYGNRLTQKREREILLQNNSKMVDSIIGEGI